MSDGGNGHKYHPRTAQGWKKKQALLLAKAPVLTEENPCDVGRRRINCRRYEKCLDYAMAQDWYGFHCDKCPVDDEYTGEELLERSRGAFGGYPEALFDELGEEESARKETQLTDEVGIDEACEILGKNKTWAKRLGNEGKVKMRGDGDVFYFERASLVAYREAKGTAAPAKAESPERKKIRLIRECVDAGVLSAAEALGKVWELVG